MTYHVEDYKTYLEKLEDFKKIDWIKNHLQLMKKPNFWTILEYGESKGSQERLAHETRSSRMLRWLVDANETHNLGNIFAHKLVELIGGDYKFQPEKNKAIKSTAEDMDIDVLYKDLSQNMCLAIEVKQFAKEGKTTGFDSQLDKYEALVKERISQLNQDIQPYYIYLTPLKEEPSNKNWHPVSYQELIDIIHQVFAEYLSESDDRYVEDTKKVISDFKDDLQRSIDYLQKDHQYIREALTDKERELTLDLAEEIQHETDSKYLDQLLAQNEDKDSDIKDLILIIKDYTKAQIQKHSPNDAVRILMRKIYNYLSADKKLDTDFLRVYKVSETISPIKTELIHKYNLDYDKIELTRGKGQGLYLYHKDNKYRIYLSGDVHGHFPNDGIQLLTDPEKAIVQLSKHVANRQFNVQNELILEDRISYRAGGDIDLETLMEEYVMQAIKELNDSVVGVI